MVHQNAIILLSEQQRRHVRRRTRLAGASRNCGKPRALLCRLMQRTCEDRTDAELREDLVLQLVHAPEPAVGSIVMSAQVQQPMDCVEKQSLRRVVCSSVSRRLASGTQMTTSPDRARPRIQIDGKGEHVGRSGKHQIPFMQACHG